MHFIIFTLRVMTSYLKLARQITYHRWYKTKINSLWNYKFQECPKPGTKARTTKMSRRRESKANRQHIFKTWANPECRV